MDEAKEIAPGIVVEGDKRRGKPVVKGSHVRVEDVLDGIAQGSNLVLLCEKCHLSLEGIRAAIGYAADIVADEPESRHPDVEELVPGITRDGRVRFGKPVLTGTRVDAATVLGSVSAGDSLEDVAEGYGVELEQVRAAFAYAHSIVSRETVSTY